MLIAILNCCTKEELEEEDEEEEETPIEPSTPDSVDPEERRRNAIKEKILAVGRMSRVFGLMRCVSLILTSPFFVSAARRETDATSSSLFRCLFLDS